MLLVGAIPLALIGGFVGLITTPGARNAAEQLRTGEYRESPRYVELAGSTYELLGPVDSSRLRHYRLMSDSLKRAGWYDYQIERLAEETGDLKRAYVFSRISVRDTADDIYWTIPLSLASVGLMGFSLWTLWVWLGARANPPTRREVF
jgi:hypothetical protein